MHLNIDFKSGGKGSEQLNPDAEPDQGSHGAVWNGGCESNPADG